MQQLFIIEGMSFFQKTAMALLFLGITLLLSVLVYRFYEWPILKYKDRKFRRN